MCNVIKSQSSIQVLIDKEKRDDFQICCFGKYLFVTSKSIHVFCDSQIPDVVLLSEGVRYMEGICTGSRYLLNGVP